MTCRRSILPLLLLALVAGCHKDTPANDKRSASGEVLQGTTSDAMLPLGQLTSEPPLLAPSEKKSTPEGVADQATGLGEASSAAPAAADTEAPPAPAPAASPSGAP